MQWNWVFNEMMLWDVWSRCKGIKARLPLVDEHLKKSVDQRVLVGYKVRINLPSKRSKTNNVDKEGQGGGYWYSA